jgi:hypothetical protein
VHTVGYETTLVPSDSLVFAGSPVTIYIDIETVGSGSWRFLDDIAPALGAPSEIFSDHVVYDHLPKNHVVNGAITVQVAGKTITNGVVEAGTAASIYINFETVDSANWATLSDMLAADVGNIRSVYYHYEYPALSDYDAKVYENLTKNLIVSDRILVNTEDYPEEYVPVGQVVRAGQLNKYYGSQVTIRLNPATTAPTVDLSTLTTVEALKQVAADERVKDLAYHGIFNHPDASAYQFKLIANVKINTDSPSLIFDKGVGEMGQVVPAGSQVTVYLSR